MCGDIRRENIKDRYLFLYVHTFKSYGAKVKKKKTMRNIARGTDRSNIFRMYILTYIK